MGFEILTEWDYPGSDIYFSAAYHKSFETSMQRQAQAFIYEAGSKKYFFPYMLGKVPGHDCTDFETVYGYSGPLATTQDTDFLKTAWNEFGSYCRENNIICGMVRYHPLLENQARDAVFNRNTVALELNDSLWPGYHPKLRNDLVRAGKLELELAEILVLQFADMYEATMKRIGAAEFYNFAPEHFQYLQNNAKIVAIMEAGKPIAAAVFLLSGEFIHYHLAASSEAPNQAYASKLLIHKIAEWGASNSYKTMHLGGGRTAAADDSLLFFKKRFGGKLCDFYIGKYIFNQNLYDQVCNQWRAKGGVAPNGFLQPYRLPI